MGFLLRWPTPAVYNESIKVKEIAMIYVRRRCAIAASLVAGLVLAALALADDRKPDNGLATWNRVVDQAAKYLRTTQADDGSWSKDKSPGVTGVALTGLLRCGRVGIDDPMPAKALHFVESLINPQAGHIAGKDPTVQLQNYVTSINVMALAAANRDDRYGKVIGDAAEFLKKLQWDEDEGRNPRDDFYGGAGYDSKSRPDLSNTQVFLDALQAAGVPRDDPALKKALLFVSRCQNLKGESNDQPWAAKINDGSFIYSPAAGGQTKADTLPNGGLPGYGSMTYAGIKSLIYCGASREDRRIKEAYGWIVQHYGVEKNPGMPDNHSQWGLFYYYHTMAKTLDTLGIDMVVDAKGIQHDWRADILRELTKRQRPDGSWLNVNHWMEADPNLVTGYALMALSHCRPKK